MNGTNGSNGWSVYRSSRATTMSKYRNQMVVIVSGKKVKALYLTDKVMDVLGNPKYILFQTRGNNIALCSRDEPDGGAFKVQRPPNTTFAKVSVVALANDYRLVSGVYTAHMEGSMLVFDSAQTPSIL